MTEYHLAQINIARMKGTNIDDPMMKEFVDNLEPINSLAEKSEGFVWRLKDDSNNATHLNPYDNEQIIVNYSIWKDVKSLENFVFRTMHAEFLRRRKEWFQKLEQPSTAMWWVPKGTVPTLAEAVDKLDQLQKNGASERIFDFKNKYSPPIDIAS